MEADKSGGGRGGTGNSVNVTVGIVTDPSIFDIISVNVHTNMQLVDEQYICVRILGTNFKRYRLRPLGIRALGDWLTSKYKARMTKPG